MLSNEKPILLISCYELGHQPAGIATAAGFLARAGRTVQTMDVSVDGFDKQKAASAQFVGISVPMHTALRLAVRVAEAVRTVNPNCHICFYGLYAELNADHLLTTVADSVIAGEFESAMVELVRALETGTGTPIDGVSSRDRRSLPIISRLDYAVPSRSDLRPLERYARLDQQGQLRLAGYTEASRGCLHHCTHCPIPPVYGGRFFAVPVDVVMSDIRQLVALGAQHVTFGDPDFLNGPTHSLRIARALHNEFPSISFDFTAKVEHLIKHRELLAEFASLGCLFVVSAVESLSDKVLRILNKGHSRYDADIALQELRRAGITLRPTFVAFTPWTSIDDYIDVLEWVEENELIDHVDPVQFSIKLLVPPGSLLLADPEARASFGSLDQQLFTYNWFHRDPRMDLLHGEVSTIVERAASREEDTTETFGRIREVAYAVRGDIEAPREVRHPDLHRPRVPRLTEAWFC